MKSDDDFPFDEDEILKEEVDFKFELNNSADGTIITLVCSSSRPLEPEEYAFALRSFLDRMDAVMSMTDISGTMN